MENTGSRRNKQTNKVKVILAVFSTKCQVLDPSSFKIFTPACRLTAGTGFEAKDGATLSIDGATLFPKLLKLGSVDSEADFLEVLDLVKVSLEPGS